MNSRLMYDKEVKQVFSARNPLPATIVMHHDLTRVAPHLGKNVAASIH
jgi:hypothetical protein